MVSQLCACGGDDDSGDGDDTGAGGKGNQNGGAAGNGTGGDTVGGASMNGGSSSGGGGTSGGTAGNGGSAGSGGLTSDLPEIPVGLDAFSKLEALPNLRIGQRAYMRSTYDRAGGNEGADASHFLRQESDDFNVTLDVAGVGVLEFARTNHWHGSPWHYVVDGTDNVVTESSTATPTAPVSNSVFIPEEQFPSPLAMTWSATKGADLNWVAMPFEESFTLAYGRTHYGTGYYIYHLFDPAADNLSAPIAPWTDSTTPPSEVLDLLNQAGTDIAPSGDGVTVENGTVSIEANGSSTLADLTGPGMVRALTLIASTDQSDALKKARLKVTWDNRDEASIDAPLTLFFGTGSFYNRSAKDALVKALLLNVVFEDTNLRLASYYPMPFFEGAHFEIVAGDTAITDLNFEIRTTPYTGPANHVGYFHATYKDHGTPIYQQDLVILDTTEAEGGGSFCGSFAGMSWIFSDNAQLGTLEGDPRMFFDDSNSPQGYGTGTEEWGGGGDYWGGQTMSIALAGHPVGAPSGPGDNAEDRIESAYRLLVSDLMPFGKNARIQLEHGGGNDSGEHYQSVAYWYGLPGECLTLTDELHVGDTDDEAAHAYSSPDASDVETLTTKYELGLGTPDATDTGRHTTGDSEFTVALDANNLGAVIRRKLDYGYPDQRAEVSIAGPEEGAEFEPAGIWYLAGSNSCVYSNPGGELDAPTHTVQTSNRRWREDEFIVPRSLTAGKTAIRVRIHFTPTDTPILEGGDVPEQAWSEYRYSVYSYVLPEAPL